MKQKFYPALTVNTDAICTNARVLCELCRKNGIAVAGVIKFSDGAVPVGKAYLDGGCAQLAVSRAKHLRALKEAFPEKETLLTRCPTRGEMEETARYSDLTLMAEESALIALNEAAERCQTNPGVILMLDVGDLREGVDNIPDLVSLARLCESLPNLRLRGVGTNHACMSGVLPNYENLSFLVEGAEQVEKAIGRRLELISGGSSINLLLLRDGMNTMPARINHLRLGGTIANPITIRLGRGLVFEGTREDTVRLTAEIIELREKNSAPKDSTQNWMGKAVSFEDRGRRLRAILALGSQDVGDSSSLIPLDPGVTVVGCSSDHTIVDLTDAERRFSPGDTLSFAARYANILYAFTGDHIAVEYVTDPQ